MRYQPALDGVRALAVAVVLLFHAEVPGFSGGYLGVSVFFTLSGFLITSLLVAEIDREGRVGLASFYARRARRLLPASLACIAAVVLIAAVTPWFDDVSTLRRDVLGSLLQVANWVSLLGGGSYQELFDTASGAVSPLEHYWSLAIEEQFYWLWPVLFVGLGAVARSTAGRRRAILALTALSAAAAPVIASVWGADAAYWATPARAAEILMGASLAVLLAGRSLSARWWWLAPIALVALAVMVTTFPAAGGPAYAGALPLVAVVSAMLLLGLQATGPARTALSWSPLVWLGTVSYGVYLYHWPVFVLLDAQRLGIDGPPLLALRLTVTLVIAQLSYALLERPVRQASWAPRRVTLLGGLGLTGALAVGALVVLPGSTPGYWTIDDTVADAAALDEPAGPLAPLAVAPSAGRAAGAAAAGPVPMAPTGEASVVIADAPTPLATAEASDTSTDTSTAGPARPAPASTVPRTNATTSTASTTEAPTTPTTPTTTVPAPIRPPLPEVLPRPVRIAVAGDSTATATGAGLVNWATAHPDRAAVEVLDGPGCGFVRGGDFLSPDFRKNQSCGEWSHGKVPASAVEKRVDVVALITTSWDILDQRLPGGLEGSVLDADVARYVADELRALTSMLVERGTTVVWLRHPVPHPHWVDDDHEADERARHEAMYRIMEDIAADFPGDVYVVDLAGHTSDLEYSREARPDGVHWTPEVATAIATEYLGDELLRAALDLEPR